MTMKESDNPVMKAIFERRSIRAYTDDAVSHEDLNRLLEAGRWAPSGLNNQPFRFLVLMPQDERTDKLAECTKYTHVVRRAGALICVFLEKEAIYSEMKDHQGAGACIQNIMLAAHSLGLGSVWLGQIINDQEAALAALGLSTDKYELQAVIALGHPDQKGSSDRKPLSQLLVEEF